MFHKDRVHPARLDRGPGEFDPAAEVLDERILGPLVAVVEDREPQHTGVVDDRDGLPGPRAAHRAGPVVRAAVKASQRWVYSDYRVVDFAARRNAAESTAQLAAEIVLRTSTW